MSPSISVALVTRNRPESLRRTLTSLRCQDTQPAEIVVSDDSDEPHCYAVEALAQSFSCRYIRGPRRGLYANRNAAAMACTGTHVRSMDDDHEFPASHFLMCQRAVVADQHSVWIIGEFLLGAKQNGSPDCPGQLNARGYSSAPVDPDNCWSLACGASIFPRSIFSLGIMNAEFFRFGASYLEFGSRLSWLGKRIRFLTNTHIIHHFDHTKRSYCDQREMLASQVFAMLCHSQMYKPCVKNKLLAMGEIMKIVMRRPRTARHSIPMALAAYFEQRSVAFRQKAQVESMSGVEGDHLKYGEEC